MKTARVLLFRLLIPLLLKLNSCYTLEATDNACMRKVCTKVGETEECGKTCICAPLPNQQKTPQGMCAGADDFSYDYNDETFVPTDHVQLPQTALQTQHSQGLRTSLQPQQPHASATPGLQAHGGYGGGSLQAGYQSYGPERGAQMLGGHMGAQMGAMPMGGGIPAARPGGFQDYPSYGQYDGAGYGLQQNIYQQYPRYGPSTGSLALQGLSLGMQNVMSTINMRNHMRPMYSTYAYPEAGPIASAPLSPAETPTTLPEPSTSSSLSSKTSPSSTPLKPAAPPPVPSRSKTSSMVKDLPPPPPITRVPPPVPPHKHPLSRPAPPHGRLSSPPSVPPHRKPLPPPPVPTRVGSLSHPPSKPLGSLPPPPPIPQRGISLGSAKRPGGPVFPSSKPLPKTPRRWGLKFKFPKFFKG